MIKFELYNESYEGHIELVYNAEEELIMVNSEPLVSYKKEAVRKFLQCVPMTVEELKTFVAADKKRKAIDVLYEPTFEEFYNLYGKKINKLRAQKLWAVMSRQEKIDCMQSVPKYNNYIKLNQWRNKKDPDTYLRNKEWQSEFK